MVQATSLASSLALWRQRADTLPAPLAAALAASSDGMLDHSYVGDVLDLLAMLGCDAPTQAAALWFELERVDPSRWQQVAAQQPEEIQRLLSGQHAAEKVWALHAQHHGGGTEGLRRLLLAIIRDLRVVFVLLARQLARMRIAAQLPAEERQELASLTRDMHSPLANRLGIWQLKWELEDLAFRYLQPDTYKRIAKLLDERRLDREAFIRQTLSQLGMALQKAGLKADLAGRPKHIYSICKKMQRKGLDFSELYDIRAVRILVDSVSDCYAALGVVHCLWPHLPKEFDDYIARPKNNGYRSLHTAVVGPYGKPVEVQIRTHAMHRDNELGVAAHWRYKEGGSGHVEFEQKIAWMRQLLDARGDDSDLAEGLKTELLEDRVYLLTPKGEVLDLPHGATVLDFAYHVHTEVGHRCRGAKVNGRIVQLSFQPQSGDRIEIITGKQAEPSRDWLSPHHGYLHSSRARDKVRSWFRKLQQEANLAAGRAILERELKRLGLPAPNLDRLPTHFHLKNHDELLFSLALGDISAGQIARALLETELPAVPASTLPPVSPRRAEKQEAGALRIEGVGNLLTVLAHCCQPLPGDPVRGYITKGRGVSVHRKDCPSLARLTSTDPNRVIEVEWSSACQQSYEVEIALTAYDRKDLQKDVVGEISHLGLHILAFTTRVTKSGDVMMHFTVRLRDYEQLSTLLAKLLALPNVTEARRISTS